jgi:hypothetical protein
LEWTYIVQLIVQLTAGRQQSAPCNFPHCWRAASNGASPRKRNGQECHSRRSAIPRGAVKLCSGLPANKGTHRALSHSRSQNVLTPLKFYHFFFNQRRHPARRSHSPIGRGANHLLAHICYRMMQSRQGSRRQRGVSSGVSGTAGRRTMQHHTGPRASAAKSELVPAAKRALAEAEEAPPRRLGGKSAAPQGNRWQGRSGPGALRRLGSQRDCQRLLTLRQHSQALGPSKRPSTCAQAAPCSAPHPQAPMRPGGAAPIPG